MISTSSSLTGPKISSCRHVDNYEKLNRIEEGSYGIVYRAKNKSTNKIVALKKLKLETEKNGFPITSLREIQTLKMCKHTNIVQVLEIVTTSDFKHIFIVMEYVEHDLKALMTSMKSPFTLSEAKTLVKQLLSAVAFMHSMYIVHRDLKTSNLLMTNTGQIKVADFGLARRFGSPLREMTQLVVTLWYRSPELLMGAKEYGTAVDVWSIGCIFAEIITKTPLFPGTSEIDQLAKIWRILGSPDEKRWPGYMDLSGSTMLNFGEQVCVLQTQFAYLSRNAVDLMYGLLELDPAQRLSCVEALCSGFFTEMPPPKDASMFPSFPSSSGGIEKTVSPAAPRGHQIVDE